MELERRRGEQQLMQGSAPKQQLLQQIKQLQEELASWQEKCPLQLTRAFSRAWSNKNKRTHQPHFDFVKTALPLSGQRIVHGLRPRTKRTSLPEAEEG